jgi:hypothetical protein
MIRTGINPVTSPGNSRKRKRENRRQRREAGRRSRTVRYKREKCGGRSLIREVDRLPMPPQRSQEARTIPYVNSLP